MYLVSQVSESTAKVVEEVSVKTQPQLTPESIKTYGAQSVMIAAAISLITPLMKHLFLMFNRSARERALREEKALTAQIDQASIMRKQIDDQNKFMQDLIRDSQKMHDDNAIKAADLNNQVLNTLSSSLKSIDKKIELQARLVAQLGNYLNKDTPVRVVIESVNGEIQIKPLKIIERDTE